jgi:hypothetical protein
MPRIQCEGLPPPFDGEGTGVGVGKHQPGHDGACGYALS